MTTKKKKPTPAAATTASGRPIQPSRVGRVMIGGHFLPTVQRELKILAAQEGSTMGDLLREAVTLLLSKRGLPSVDKLEGLK
jgi:hypothetical protein